MEEWTRIRLRRGVVQKFPCHNCRVGGVQKHSDVDMEKVPDYESHELLCMDGQRAVRCGPLATSRAMVREARTALAPHG